MANWVNDDFITQHDLAIAYRKVKADLYYEQGHANLCALLEYEEQLEENLETLYELLHDLPLYEWVASEDFVGRWSVIAKRLRITGATPGRWRASNPDDAWQGALKRTSERPTAEFRPTGVHPIHFHVFGSLWISKVGRYMDAALGPEAFGSRLRATDPRVPKADLEAHGELSTGSFRPYYEAFRRWRDDGLAAMRTSLDAGRRVVAITADVRQFYHSLDPSFLNDPSFLRALGLSDRLSDDQRALNDAMVSAMRAWSERSPRPIHGPLGLPVGLSAARVAANVSLAAFDKAILDKLTPVYYGRYVDDILLVLDDRQGFSDEREVWEFIKQRVGRGVLSINQATERDDKLSVQIHAPFLRQSDLQLTGDKQRMFSMAGTTGKDLVGSIARAIHARSSEWRSLPDIPEDGGASPPAAVGALDADGDDADNLRKADALSTRRARFAIALRDAEAFAQDLPPEAWADHRSKFFEMVSSYVLSLPRMFEFENYVPRLVAVAVASGDFRAASHLLDRIQTLMNTVERDCNIQLLDNSAPTDTVVRWRTHLGRMLLESAAAALFPGVHASDKAVSGLLRQLAKFLPIGKGLPSSSAELKRLSARLFWRDLGRSPFRFTFIPGNPLYRATPGRVRGLQSESSTLDSQWIPPKVWAGGESFIAGLQEDRAEEVVPPALLWPTRPFSFGELCLIVQSRPTSATVDDAAGWYAAFRGMRMRRPPLKIHDGHRVEAHLDRKRETIKIAVTSWHTPLDSWAAAAEGSNDPHASERYLRLNRLMNDIMKAEARPDYVVLPELAVPAGWFLRVAGKLARRGISLIAGVDYLPSGRRTVANQVWASLITHVSGCVVPALYVQDKQRPALHEEAELHRLFGKRLRPVRSSKVVPTVQHGDFIFSILVCSELTDISKRADLRGEVDALFVPEWNQDTNTFASLVESASVDVHAYIVQCNHRDYGDTRIRAPHKDEWARDIVRVKGGVSNYFVIGQIDVRALRRFQSSFRSPSGPFKPVPDGYVICRRRRMLPQTRNREE